MRGSAGDKRDMVEGHDLAHIIAAERADQTWRTRAACRGLDPDLFFQERGENSAPAKAICSGCPVAAQCLEYALTAYVRQGVWGGLTDQELRLLRRRRRAA